MAPAAAKVLDFNRPDTAQSVGTELASTTESLLIRLSDVDVVDILSCEQAVLDRQTLGEAIHRVEDFFAPFKKMAYDLWKALCARENSIIEPLRTLDKKKQDAIRGWSAEQERIRQRRERELAEEQRRVAEAHAAAEAAALEAAGDHELAASVLEEAISAPLPVATLPSIKSQVAGLKTTRRWLWKYSGGPQDVKQTTPAIQARTMKLVPREYLKLDEQKIGATVRAHKGSIVIPGIDVFYVDDPVR